MSEEDFVNNEPRKTILIVEDSPVQALALIHLLEQQGLRVFCAPNGNDGVSLARARQPELIVLDIQMPEMNGLEACRIIKSDPTTRDIPIIFLTAHGEPELLQEGLGNGAIDFILKDAFSEIVLLKTLYQLGMISNPDAKEEA
jgi:two-component system, NtrC family, sensor kinase